MPRASPSDTAEPARMGGMQDGCNVRLRVGHHELDHGVVSRGATAGTLQNTVWELVQDDSRATSEMCQTTRWW